MSKKNDDNVTSSDIVPSIESVKLRQIPTRGECIMSYMVDSDEVFITKNGRYLVSTPTINSDIKKHYEDFYPKIQIQLDKKADPKEKLKILKEELKKEAKETGILDEFSAEYKKIQYYLKRELIGYGIIDVLINDTKIEDIICTGYDKYIGIVHRDVSEFTHLKTNIKFGQSILLDEFLRKILQKIPISPSRSAPIIYATMKEKHRLTVTWEDVITRNGHEFYIRKFPQIPLTIIDLLQKGTITELMAAYIWLLTDARSFHLIYGETSSGKTTLINAMLCMSRPDWHVVTIEDTQELQVPHYYTSTYVTKTSPYKVDFKDDIGMEELVRLALRAEIQLAIIGEVRGKEATYAFRSGESSHGGMLSFHADSPESAISSLTSPMHGINYNQLKQLGTMIRVEKTSKKKTNKRIRRITDITEIIPQYNTEISAKNETKSEIQLKQIFSYDAKTDSFSPNTIEELLELNSFRMKKACDKLGINDLKSDLIKRIKILRECKTKKKKTPDQVIKYIGENYYQIKHEKL